MFLVALSNPILVAAGDDVHLAGSIETKRDRHRSIEKVAIVANDQHRAVIIGDHLLEQVQRLEVEIRQALAIYEAAVQARALYIRNLFRIIADIKATPVAVLPIRVRNPPRFAGAAPFDTKYAFRNR